MTNSFIQRFKVRKYHAQKYAKLGHTFFDSLKLAWLGWKRIEALNDSTVANANQWSARIKTLHGMSLTLCPEDICHISIFEELLVYHCYNFDLIRFDPEIIIDVGAHIGLFSILASSHWPNSLIFAFEPHPENVVWARRNFDQNSLRGCVIEAVAGSLPDQVFFDVSSGMGQVKSGTGSIRLPSVDLRAFIHSFSCHRILLKMDIEGAELQLLPEAMEVFPPGIAVFVELHGALWECENLIKRITANGYQIKITSHRISQSGDEHYMDLFFEPQLPT